MTAQEAVAANMLQNATLSKHKVPLDTYWSKVYAGQSEMSPSPSHIHADASTSINVTIMGRFEMGRTHACRWRLNDKFVGSPGVLDNADALDSTADNRIRICEQSGVPAKNSPCFDLEAANKCSDPVYDRCYYNQLE